MDINKFKIIKIDYDGLLILFAIFISSWIMHAKLEELRLEIHNSTVPKMEISDPQQFSKLCEQFATQWSAKGYAFYLLQPKSPAKTHKERISASNLFDKLPIRTDLTDSVYNKKLREQRYFVGSANDEKHLLNIPEPLSSSFVVIPVYQYDTVVGELYMFYDNEFDITSIESKVSEAQTLSRLIN